MTDKTSNKQKQLFAHLAAAQSHTAQSYQGGASVRPGVKLLWEKKSSLFSTGSEGKESLIFSAVASLEYRKLHSTAGTKQVMMEGIITQPPGSFFSWELLNRTAASAAPEVLIYTWKHKTCWSEDIHSWVHVFTQRLISAVYRWSYFCPWYLPCVFPRHGLNTPLKSVSLLDPD